MIEDKELLKLRVDKELSKLNDSKELSELKNDVESSELKNNEGSSKPKSNEKLTETRDTHTSKPIEVVADTTNLNTTETIIKEPCFFIKLYRKTIKLFQDFLVNIKNKLLSLKNKLLSLKDKLIYKLKLSVSMRRMSKLANKIKKESKGQFSIKQISQLIDGLESELKVLNASEITFKLVDKTKKLVDKIENSDDPREIEMFVVIANAMSMNSVQPIEKKKELLKILAEFISHIGDSVIRNKYLDCIKFFQDFLTDIEDSEKNKVEDISHKSQTDNTFRKKTT
jgi:hypothetical protein